MFISQAISLPSLQDTPHGRIYPDAKTIEQLKAMVKQDLGTLVNGGDVFKDNAFPHLKTQEWDTKIGNFLAKTEFGYDSSKRSWSGIPQDTRAERDLYEPLVDIIKKVISFFGIRKRRALNTSRVYVPHEQEGAEMLDSSQLRPEEAERLEDASNAKPVLKSAPDIMIVGRGGQCFENERYPAKPTYAACATVWEVKLNTNSGSFEDHVAQLYIYAKQCFYEQKNRDFLHAVLITQTDVQLFHFNRSLLVHSSRFNYHYNPETFVRMVLGMLSPDESHLGFDMSIFWTTEPNTAGESVRVQKMKLILSEPNAEIKIWQVVNVNGNRWRTKEIRGRATTCWSITQNGLRRLVKKLWRIQGRDEEWSFFKAVKGIKGVAQMYCYEEGGTALTHASLVKGIFTEGESQFDRIWCCVTFEEYGPTLESFKSVLHLLYAFLDAVNGHWNLWNIGILHRDISLNNVLFGRKYAKAIDPLDPKIKEGYRGVIIDLDLAIWISRTESNRNDVRTGTKIFQSSKVLFGGGWPHDFLDDLESFCLLLAWVLLTYKAPGVLRENPSRILNDWSGDNLRLVSSAKDAHLSSFDRYIGRELKGSELGQPILKLLKNLCALLVGLPNRMERSEPCPPEIKCVADLHTKSDVDDFYTRYIGYIKTAIEEQKAEDAKNDAEKPMTIVKRDSSTPSPAERGGTSAPTATTSLLPPLRRTMAFPSAPAGPSNPSKRKQPHQEKVEDVDATPDADAPTTPKKRVRVLSSATIRPERSSESLHPLVSSPDPMNIVCGGERGSADRKNPTGTVYHSERTPTRIRSDKPHRSDRPGKHSA